MYKSLEWSQWEAVVLYVCIASDRKSQNLQKVSSKFVAKFSSKRGAYSTVTLLAKFRGQSTCMCVCMCMCVCVCVCVYVCVCVCVRVYVNDGV